MTTALFAETERCVVPEFKSGLLKWVGNKQRNAHVIASHFPSQFGTFFEPFLGSGGVLGTLAPKRAIASDVFCPLLEIWQALSSDTRLLKSWYAERWEAFSKGDRVARYLEVRDSYNRKPNGADLLFLCRTCYGGIVRFRKADGFMSTPCGVHDPIRPASFNRRADEWAMRTRGVDFLELDFAEALDLAEPGDLVYCDPPYSDSQSILYGAQAFDLSRLVESIERCKSRGVYVALSIDGTKKSGKTKIDIPTPTGLFEQEVMIDCGVSMLRRFQRAGEQLSDEVVADRLLLTYSH
ncbi:MAG TPA: Dam family site-specific DNA-(adenine-N6)-methyltransferase [Acidobacteriaceae bacterium]|nr:Dam family site-specific DNA-(adenine-N6)-methyltransferase [Acidobacteriaceae bacterium]